ncbi:MAG: IS200/IS605 family transposase [Acidimicrobiia bacterium]
MERDFSPEIRDTLFDRWKPVYRSRLHYLIAWTTRGRRPVFKDVHLIALKKMILEICDERGYAPIEIALGSNQVHLLIGMKPSQSVAGAVREIRGRSAMSLLTQYPELRVRLRGSLFWDERYEVETVSTPRLDRVRTRLQAIQGRDEGLAAAS